MVIMVAFLKASLWGAFRRKKVILGGFCFCQQAAKYVMPSPHITSYHLLLPPITSYHLKLPQTSADHQAPKYVMYKEGWGSTEVAGEHIW